MRAKDVMTTEVVYAGPETDVRTIVQELLKRRISAVPVVDDGGRVIGIVSEGDLMRRAESDTEHHRSWWLQLLQDPEDRASEYLKTHGLKARDVMTRNPVTVSEDTSLDEIATLLERNGIKRVPVLRNGKLVGIVSRADLLHGLVARASQEAKSVAASGPTREDIIATIRASRTTPSFFRAVSLRQWARSDELIRQASYAKRRCQPRSASCYAAGPRTSTGWCSRSFHATALAHATWRSPDNAARTCGT